MRFILLGGIAVAMFTVRLPFHTMIAASLDVEDHYRLTIKTPGFITTPIGPGVVDPGQQVVRLNNPTLEDQITVLQQSIATTKLAYTTVQGVDPAQAIAVKGRQKSLEERLSILSGEISDLTLESPVTALFIPVKTVRTGQYFTSGEPVGQLFPIRGQSAASGPFEERYVTKFQSGVTAVEVRINGEYSDIDPTRARLQPVLYLDAASGKRSFLLKLELDIPPADLAEQPVDVRLSFRREPLWSHAKFWLDGMIAKYREAQLLDRNSLLNAE